MSADQPFGLLGDLTEELVPIAASLAEKIHDEGPEAIRHVLLSVHAMEEKLTPEARELLRHTPGGIWGAFAAVCAAMVNPDAGMKELLGWTEPLVSLHVFQDEAERLRLLGVTTATTLARASAQATHHRRATA